MMNKQWTQLKQDEINLIEEECSILGARVISQNEDADRIIEDQDDLGHTWRETWYDEELICTYRKEGLPGYCFCGAEAEWLLEYRDFDDLDFPYIDYACHEHRPGGVHVKNRYTGEERIYPDWPPSINWDNLDDDDIEEWTILEKRGF